MGWQRMAAEVLLVKLKLAKLEIVSAELRSRHAPFH
jgi:hypothetical protein